MALPPVKKKKADKKYPPEDGEEPVDADEEQDEKERKGRAKPNTEKNK